MIKSFSKDTAQVTRLSIKTGTEGCYAYFYPAIYQLTLIQDDVEKKIELGFSRSRLLERLLQSPGEVVTREELMSHAWPGRVVGQGSLNQQIYTLRQALNDEKTSDIIQTLPRRGYQFNAHYVLEQVDEPVETSAPVPSQVDAPVVGPVSWRTRAKRFAPASFFALGLMAFGAAGYLYQCTPPERCSTIEEVQQDVSSG